MNIPLKNLVIVCAVFWVLGVGVGFFGVLWVKSLDPEAQRRAETARLEQVEMIKTVVVQTLNMYQQQLTNRMEHE